MKISVVVTNYNTANYLDLLLTKIHNSDLRNHEILVDIDGSTDDSLAVCNKFGITPSGIDDHQGYVTPLNRCVQRATGDFVLINDCDMIPRKNVAEIVTKYAHKRRLLCGIYLEPFKRGSSFPYCPAGQTPSEYDDAVFESHAAKLMDKLLYKLNESRYYFIGPKLIPINMFQDVGFFDERLNHWPMQYEEFLARCVLSKENYEFPSNFSFVTFHFGSATKSKVPNDFRVEEKNPFLHTKFKEMKEIFAAVRDRGKTVF